MSNKPRHPPEVPGGGTEIIRELHGKIQEGYGLARKLQALLAEIRAAADQLNATADRVREEASAEAVKELLEPTIKLYAHRMLQFGDKARDVLEAREAQFTSAVTKAAGLKTPEELVTMIAAMISGEVMEAITRIGNDRQAQDATIEHLVDLLPDITEVLHKPAGQPVPPKAKQRPRSHSRNQHRRHLSCPA